ncbi:ribosome maturation factor RimM [Pelagibaculum spongiae]|nr:ribosome maturation factor RimM [Pelagibaculum spongiae]
MSESEMVVLGQIGAAHGLRGWVRVQTFTDDPETVFKHPNWVLEKNGQRTQVKVESRRPSGKYYLAKVDCSNDCDQAKSLTGSNILIERRLLPNLDEGDYYWTDLEGLNVVTREGFALGKIHHLMETGSNDVLVIRGQYKGERKEHVLPFLPDDVVLEVDLKAQQMTVDWDPEF